MAEYFSLDGRIKSTFPNLFNAVRAIVPDASDPRIFDDGSGSFQVKEFIDEDSNPTLSIRIRFKSANKVDRDSIFVSLNGLSGMFNQCMEGTFIGYHTCGNYKSPNEPCNHKELYRKDWNGASSSIKHIINGVQQ